MRLSFCGLLLLPGLAAAVSPPTQPVQPTYQLVEALGTSDVYASLAINPANDQPQVAYIDTSGLDSLQPRPAPLWVRAYDGWVWRREQLGSVPMTGDVLTDGSRELRFLVDSQGGQHAVLIDRMGRAMPTMCWSTCGAMPAAPPARCWTPPAWRFRPSPWASMTSRASPGCATTSRAVVACFKCGCATPMAASL